MTQEMLDVHEHDDAILNADAEEADEADARRDGEVGAGDEQNEDAAYGRKRHVGEHQTGVARITEEHVEDDEDEQHADGHHLRQSGRGTLLVLEVAVPRYLISCGQVHSLCHLGAGLVDSGTHVAVTYAELHGAVAGVVLAIDDERTGDGAY